ncbi:SLAP domain-containing protein [Bacillus sp. FJAT-49736]|uniref:SLAP domain-containing protein n=1 Tax=Bacillus sp. FJAT-49736 TaxID=2833582 RepID=UPI001BC9AF12|nr:SLAP domain-containing protein [Bacillus sp. FJAT-49736]MBS4175581.1 SLAP domain-containing protein [Bacillus sp. FJAT-49736]
MQKLYFESAWDKTISEKDRERIREAFHKTSIPHNSQLEFTRLWEAINHKGALLVTVLIHNFDSEELTFHNKLLQYRENEEITAAHPFTLPVPIKPETSMPWTFIFPAVHFYREPLLKNGRLEIIR